MNDLPQMLSNNLVSNTVTLTDTTGGYATGGYGSTTSPIINVTALPTIAKEAKAAMSEKIKRRVVQVFIVDPDDRVPLEDSLIYQDDESRLTDLTNEELFFELPIRELLTTHNAKRTEIVDKKASERAGKDIKLDPVKIRDLRMTVVDIAKF